MAAHKVPFENVLKFLEKNGWKYHGFWNNWRFFIKPDDPDQPPIQVWVDKGNVDKDEFETIKKTM